MIAVSMSEPAVPLLDRYYEWLLSDAPAAVAERARRRDADRAAERTARGDVTAWSARILADPDAPTHLRELAEVMQRFVDHSTDAAAAAAALSDEEHTRRGRVDLENSRRAQGDFDYHYPQRYLGVAAADQPIPDDQVPAAAIEAGHRIRIWPGGAPVEIAAAWTVDSTIHFTTTDGHRWRCPASAELWRVHDDRFVPDLARDRTRRPDRGASRDLGHDL